jgi:hypothetical protein
MGRNLLVVLFVLAAGLYACADLPLGGYQAAVLVNHQWKELEVTPDLGSTKTLLARELEAGAEAYSIRGPGGRTVQLMSLPSVPPAGDK